MTKRELVEYLKTSGFEDRFEEYRLFQSLTIELESILFYLPELSSNIIQVFSDTDNLICVRTSIGEEYHLSSLSEDSQKRVYEELEQGNWDLN